MEESALRRRDYLTALVLALFLVILGSCQMLSGFCGIYHDDAIYVSTAKALAQGQGYRLINLPEAPVQTKYPILYAALLALVWKIWPVFPANLPPMRWLTLSLSAVSVGLSYLYLIRFRYATRGVALAAGLLCITTPLFLYFSDLTLSEMVFAGLSVAALWRLEVQLAGADGGRSRQFFLGVILALPFLCRTIGVVLVPVGLALLYHYGRACRWTFLGAAAALLPWLFWMVLGPRWNEVSATAYYTNYLTWWLSFGIPFSGRLVCQNFAYILFWSADLGLGALHYLPEAAWPGVMLMGCLGYPLLVKDLRRWRALSWFLAAYLGLVLVWPWPPLRFLMPILVFVTAYLLSGARSLAGWVRFGGRQRLGTLVVGALVIVNLNLVRQTVSLSQGNYYPFPKPLEEAVSWTSFAELFAWVREHTTPQDVITSGLDTMVYLYTDRRCFRPFVGRPMSMFYGLPGPPLGPDEEMIGAIKAQKARYLVFTPMPGFQEEAPFGAFVKRLREQYPGWLKPVYAGKDRRFLVFEFQAAAEPAAAVPPR